MRTKVFLILFLSAGVALAGLTPGWALPSDSHGGGPGSQDTEARPAATKVTSSTRYASTDIILSIWDPLRTGEGLVIPMFTKSSGTWTADNSALEAMEWTVAFDGRSLGIAKTEATTFSTRDGGLADRQTAKGSIPHFDHPKLKKTIQGKTVYRPLVFVSQPYYQDPDGWKRHPLSPEQTKRFREAFRKQFPTVQNCVTEGAAETPWAYPDSDIVVKDSYVSKNGTTIVGMTLTSYRCSSVADSPFNVESWFGVAGLEMPHFMQERLELIDAGDYDHDGRSELIFEDLGEGEDATNPLGYSLWSADLKQQAEFIWYSH